MKKSDDWMRLGIVVAVLVLAPAAAMAYIDPGNGAYVVQALFTLIAAAIFYLRHPITSLKALWRFLTRSKVDEPSPSRQDSAALKGPQTSSPTVQD